MTHIGIICPPVPSHINSAAAIGRDLQKQNHRVTILGILDIEAKVRSEELEFYPLGQSDHPLGSLQKSLSQLGQLSDLAALRFIIRAAEKTTRMICRDAPRAIEALGIEALLVDQTEPAGGTVADYLGIPFVTFCSALAVNQDPNLPPFFTSWHYQTTELSRLRNQLGHSLFNWLSRPITQSLNQQRRQWNLPPYRSLDDSSSQLAQISQLTADFDFPFSNQPQCFHYTGPFRRSSPQKVAFPYERLTGQPLVYASLGTLHNPKQDIFYCIAQACEGMDVQLVISLGGGKGGEQYPDLPGNPLVVEFAPQQELLTRAKLTITHAGLNTVLESLGQGVPMVALPITGDQLGVGARINWTGSGEVLQVAKVTPLKLRTAIQRVFAGDSYLRNTAKLRESIRNSGGSERAARIVERAITTRQPVLSTS